MARVAERGRRPRPDSDDEVFARLCEEDPAVGRVWRGLERFRRAGIDLGSNGFAFFVEQADGEGAHL